MISFESDYNNGAHPRVLQHLVETNAEKTVSYGGDVYSKRAADKIRAACDCLAADVFFLVGGTQTNQVVIDTLLRPYEGVVAADTGHISLHEAGAIEHGGHKVLALPHRDGRVDAADLRAYVRAFYADENHEHMVFPGMVYISHPTEYGTLYSKQELTDLAEVCREFGMRLYLDGARLGYALASYETDVTLADIARLCDAFYIGGTKVGALCGEALVFPKGAPNRFVTMVKQHGALVAKGRLIGVQFDALFTDDLYLTIGRHAIDMAEKLKAVLTEKGVPFYRKSPTNQQFVVLENSRLDALKENLGYSFWEMADDEHTVIRLATSWATDPADIERLRELF
ncbi:MAG: aminotransferase class I/II-fold pyridoxal phosphate-dependent enzyme [Clostridia bacterium]|nr:aminotransferase class I/II-fold pyridoxal phosphate-dependent enzyme [Clostridia bacterium]